MRASPRGRTFKVGQKEEVLLIRRVINVAGWKSLPHFKYRQTFKSMTNLLTLRFSTCPGKITSLDTSLLRATMKPGWEDLVRRCIQRFHLQNEGEISFAKKHMQDGESLCSL